MTKRQKPFKSRFWTFYGYIQKTYDKSTSYTSVPTYGVYKRLFDYNTCNSVI